LRWGEGEKKKKKPDEGVLAHQRWRGTNRLGGGVLPRSGELGTGLWKVKRSGGKGKAHKKISHVW